jgi:hypothetical protein
MGMKGKAGDRRMEIEAIFRVFYEGVKFRVCLARH